MKTSLLLALVCALSLNVACDRKKSKAEEMAAPKEEQKPLVLDPSGTVEAGPTIEIFEDAPVVLTENYESQVLFVKAGDMVHGARLVLKGEDAKALYTALHIYPKKVKATAEAGEGHFKQGEEWRCSEISEVQDANKLNYSCEAGFDASIGDVPARTSLEAIVWGFSEFNTRPVFPPKVYSKSKEIQTYAGQNLILFSLKQSDKHIGVIALGGQDARALYYSLSTVAEVEVQGGLQKSNGVTECSKLAAEGNPAKVTYVCRIGVSYLLGEFAELEAVQ